MMEGMSQVNAQEIEQALTNLHDPSVRAVARWVVDLRTDSTGELAVFVTVVLRDRDASRVWHDRERLRRAVEQKLTELAPERWPYVWMSAESTALNPETGIGSH